jgi:hypothetical protein
MVLSLHCSYSVKDKLKSQQYKHATVASEHATLRDDVRLGRIIYIKIYKRR